MKKMVTKWIAVMSLTFLTLTGCASQTNEQVDNVDQQLIQLEEANKALEENVKTLQQQVDTLTTENNSLVLEIESLKKKEYTLYARDVDTWELVEVEKITVDEDATVQEKLQALANGLSKSQFNQLEIAVEAIKKVDGKEIAVINLKDSGEGDNTWITKYFQGSTGAEMTKTALEETFLQKDLKENWIDGISFLYNGKELAIDHITMGEIIYRK